MTYTDNIPLADRIDHSKKFPAETLTVHVVVDRDRRFTMPRKSRDQQ
jgi:hypothetical protein